MEKKEQKKKKIKKGWDDFKSFALKDNAYQWQLVL